MSDQYVGEIRLYAFYKIPIGWLACDGSLKSIAQYQTLYTLIGTTYGGDGVNTFGVPDLRGQVPIHQGTGNGLSPHPLGSTGGTENVTLTSGQIPQHSHTLNALTGASTSQSPGAGFMPATIGNDDTFYVDVAGATAISMNTHCVDSVGGNQPHANLMPTLTANFCICAQGIFPSQQ
ncbi:MAG: hypothetical protein GAK28_00368 [Luteibacter sp.]|uniref:phage tail protein n=1 Tax=Luteibacter sp. TaxID=1886636 RepID=UPI00137C7D6C|nr:tail fiber protein [Luteibacter sp.]KAF1009724.1 MAG: hypothetical protein GAK28_00368 [Luteibacter sp.]